MFTKISKKILRHKFLTVISLLLFILGIYLVHQGLTKDKNPTQYATAAVEKDTIIVSVSGSGQVSASDQIDIKPKVSGDAVSVSMQNGQEVKTGDLLAQIDSREAQKTMRDAQTALETAQLELNKLLAPADELDILQAENALSAAQKNLEELINPTASGLTQPENALISSISGAGQVSASNQADIKSS
ncbi:MAG: biotin/lipoyl-binding protein, partial [Candidatus Jacksonbacteria bacterium]